MADELDANIVRIRIQHLRLAAAMEKFDDAVRQIRPEDAPQAVRMFYDAIRRAAENYESMARSALRFPAPDPAASAGPKS